MVELITEGRLPTFVSPEEIKGSDDFLGLNHYTARDVEHTGEIGRDWGNDGRFTTSPTNKEG